MRPRVDARRKTKAIGSQGAVAQKVRRALVSPAACKRTKKGYRKQFIIAFQKFNL